MPFQSEAQRRYLWMKEPEVAREFADKTPKGKKLPYHKKPEKKEAAESMRDRTVNWMSSMQQHPRFSHYFEGTIPAADLTSVANQPHWQGYFSRNKQADDGPPNLRMASPTDAAACSHCKNFQAASGSCQKYATQVTPQSVCDSFEPASLDMGSIQAAMPPTNTLPPGLSSDGVFKAGFLLRCLEEGLEPEQIVDRAEKAAAALEKRADGVLGWPGDIAGKALHATGNAYADAALAGAIGLPIGIGTVGGYALGKMRNAAESEDVDELKMENKVKRYRQLADAAGHQAKLRQLQQKHPGELVQMF